MQQYLHSQNLLGRVNFCKTGNSVNFWSCLINNVSSGLGVISFYTGKNMGNRVAMIEWFYGQTQTPKKAEKITKFPGDKREIGTLLDVVGK